jgi:hypothetical protein
MTNINDTEELATTADMATQSTEPDLVDRMRRLSVGSSESSYSLVSDAPSVRSLDSNGSVNGGVSIKPPSIEVLETCLEALTVAADALDPPSHDRKASLDTAGSEPEAKEPTTLSRPCTPTTPSPSICSYWEQFPGFVPEPKATFKDELARLAKHENWSNNARRKQQVKALTAEIAHHYGTNMNKLDRWQQLCEDVGIDVIPTSITQCKKVRYVTRGVRCHEHQLMVYRQSHRSSSICIMSSTTGAIRTSRSSGSNHMDSSVGTHALATGFRKSVPNKTTSFAFC